MYIVSPNPSLCARVCTDTLRVRRSRAVTSITFHRSRAEPTGISSATCNNSFLNGMVKDLKSLVFRPIKEEIKILFCFFLLSPPSSVCLFPMVYIQMGTVSDPSLLPSGYPERTSIHFLMF